MDWSLAIEKERVELKRFFALFLSLAALADRACGRSRPVRWLILWILRRGLAVALDCLSDTGPVPDVLVREGGDSLAEARRYARCFRAAARSVKRLLKALDRCREGEGDGPMCPDRRPSDFATSFVRGSVGCDLLASLRNLVLAATGLLRYAPATGPPLPERRDSS